MYANIEGFSTYRCILKTSAFRFNDAIAMLTQNWVEGKFHDVFTRANSVRNSRCRCYGDPKLGGKNSRCIHEVVLGTYCWDIFHFKGDILRHTLSSNPFL